MRVVALISGGKDSTFNMLNCVAEGHNIVALANLVPHEPKEIDSYMYQSVGHEAIDLIAEAMDVPLFKRVTQGNAIHKDKTYEVCTSYKFEDKSGDEVEDLFELLKTIQQAIHIEAVSVGAILSDYQRLRVENVCIRLGLIPLAFLWQRDQTELLDEMIACEVDAIIIKVAALGLEPKHLGKTLSQMQPHLHAMKDAYGLNVCGEGGEYETLTLDCPLFISRIVVVDSEVVIHSSDPIAPVGYLKFNKLELELKLPALDLISRLKGLPLKNSDDYVKDHKVKEERMKTDFEFWYESNDFSTYLTQTHSFAKSNKNGWLFIGGLQPTITTGDDLWNPKEAMQQVMNKLQYILAENGHTLKDVCSITMFISDMNLYGVLNRIYIETMKHINPPTRVCVQVPLDTERTPVLIEAISWKAPTIANSVEQLDKSGDNGSLSIIERNTMHVQSRSHWAPANIGPYSQATKIGDITFIAGQIGMVPASLVLLDSNTGQCLLALENIARLLKAMDANLKLRDVVQAICYVRYYGSIPQCREIWESKSNNAIVDYVIVSELPREASCEWHVWAHKHNNQFEYEETGKTLIPGTLSVAIYRRWLFENNISTIICHVEKKSTKEKDFVIDDYVSTILSYLMEKLQQTSKTCQQGQENNGGATISTAKDFIYKLTVFYRMDRVTWDEAGIIKRELENLKLLSLPSLCYTLVPVVGLKSNNVVVSFCGVKFQ